jgi:hypothetical protein
VIYIAIGRRRLGKTTLTCYMASRVAHRVMFDPRGLIDSTMRVRSADQLRTLMAVDLSRTDERLREVVITPEANIQDTFDVTARYVKVWSKTRSEPLFFLVDEARFIKMMDSPAFEYLVRASNPNQIHIAITAHRPADIPTDIRAISDHWLLFRSTQEHDLKVIEDRCGVAVRRRVMQLKPHEFVHWNDAEGTWSANTNPSSWYVPLGVPDHDADIVIPETTDTTRLL